MRSLCSLLTDTGNKTVKCSTGKEHELFKTLAKTEMRYRRALVEISPEEPGLPAPYLEETVSMIEDEAKEAAKAAAKVEAKAAAKLAKQAGKDGKGDGEVDESAPLEWDKDGNIVQDVKYRVGYGGRGIGKNDITTLGNSPRPTQWAWNSMVSPWILDIVLA